LTEYFFIYLESGKTGEIQTEDSTIEEEEVEEEEEEEEISEVKGEIETLIMIEMTEQIEIKGTIETIVTTAMSETIETMEEIGIKRKDMKEMTEMIEGLKDKIEIGVKTDISKTIGVEDITTTATEIMTDNDKININKDIVKVIPFLNSDKNERIEDDN